MRELVLGSQGLQVIELIKKFIISVLGNLCEVVLSFVLLCHHVVHFFSQVRDVVHVHLLIELLHQFGTLADA